MQFYDPNRMIAKVRTSCASEALIRPTRGTRSTPR
jgi:hypothetical protein